MSYDPDDFEQRQALRAFLYEFTRELRFVQAQLERIQQRQQQAAPTRQDVQGWLQQQLQERTDYELMLSHAGKSARYVPPGTKILV